MKIGPIYKSPVASSIPYDDTIQTPLSGTDDVQEMLDYLIQEIKGGRKLK